jgi:hypothetical protein
MTKKDFEAIAAALKGARLPSFNAQSTWGKGYQDGSRAQFQKVFDSITGICRVHHPGFDSDKFKKAVGL